MIACCATCARRNWGEIDNLIDPDMCYCHEFDMEVAKDDDPCAYYDPYAYYEERQRGRANERPERET